MASYLGDLGFIFHVGLYNFFGFSGDQSDKAPKYGSELYYKRLKSRQFSKDGGVKETKVFHKENYGNADYFTASLNITRESIQEWMAVSRLMGAKYVVISTKYIDGYCLWNTACEGVHKSPVDIVQIFKEEANANGLKVGFLYSWVDAYVQPDVDYFINKCMVQMQELIMYKPDFFFFDGDETIRSTSGIFLIDVILEELKESGIYFNDRIVRDRDLVVESDFRVYENEEVPDEPDHEWQYFDTIGKSIGYDHLQADANFKTGEELIDLYTAVITMKGTFCLSIATDFEGVIDRREADTLLEFYKIMNAFN